MQTARDLVVTGGLFFSEKIDLVSCNISTIAGNPNQPSGHH